MRTILLILVWLVVVAPASAAEVHLASGCYKEDCTFQADYTAAPGEANRLTVTRRAPGTLVFRDAGAPLRAGQGCVAEGEAVVCTGTGGHYVVNAVLGDGDDTAVTDGTVDGGPGDDVLTGLAVTGGPGRDVVRADFIEDGEGSRPERDRYEGGWVSYKDRRAAIRIDLRGGRAGEDVLVGVRSATGGSGDDVLIGTDGPNVLWPGRGNDRVVALGGDDRIEAAEHDRVDAGAGRDRIEIGTRPEARVQIRCGSGRDYIETLGRRGFISGDCERLSIDIATNVKLRTTLFGPGAAILTMNQCWCVNSRFVVYAGRETIGSARGRNGVVLRLNARGRHLLGRSRTLPVRIEYHGGSGPEGFSTVVRLR